MFCTACGEYNHWRKDCPYDCHCDNCDSDSHATHMCRAPPKPSPNPSPQPLICIYCGSSDHRSMECSNRPRDNREEGRAPSPAPSQYSCEKQQKSALASGENSQKPNGKLKNRDKPRTSGKNSQNTKAGKQYHQQQQHPKVKTAFLTRITDTTNKRDRQGSMRNKTNNIPPITLPLHLHFLQDLTCLVIQ